MKSKDDSRWLCKRGTMQVGQSWEDQRSCGGYSKIQNDAGVWVFWFFFLRFFFFAFFIRQWRNLQWKWKKQFFLSTLICGPFAFSVSLVWRWGTMFHLSFNICDGNSCLDLKVESRRRSKVVTHPVSVICSSINPSVTPSLKQLNAADQHKPVSAFTALTSLNY